MTMTLAIHMMYAQSIEESNLKRMSKKFKRSVDSDLVQPRFKKGVQTQDGPSVPNKKFQKGRCPSNGKPTCATCGKKHFGECLIGMANCFGCGKSGHKVRDFPNVKGQYKGSGQAQATGSNMDLPRKNRFNAGQRTHAPPTPDLGRVFLRHCLYCRRAQHL